MDETTVPDLLAVYGTLMLGAAARELLRPHVDEDRGRLALPGRLYDTGAGYPAFTPHPDDDSVPAQLVRLHSPATALPLLDDYEGPEYARERMRLPSGEVCWVYTWRASTAGLVRLRHGWPTEP